ncbi:MAG: PPC domain-containing protein [Planctomycetales bacterium]
MKPIARNSPFVALVPSLLLLCGRVCLAQTAPEIGFIHPAGGQAGKTVDVILGGYDWTPDMQLFVHDPQIRLELVGPPSPVLVPDPPYWFGAKGRGPAWPLPREFPARLTIPADVSPGLVRWQVANANGASPVGLFQVGTVPEVLEQGTRQGAQSLPPLPVTVSGQIRRIEEIDRYEFSVPKPGPVTIELVARQLGSPLHGMLQVRQPDGKVLVDAADTEGGDFTVTFAAQADAKYLLSLHDLDYAGDRSYIYRLTLTAGPQVLAAYPAAGKRGETRPVEFVGIGVASGGTQLESVTRDVTFPATPGETSFRYRLETPAGAARPWTLLLSDWTEQVEPEAGELPTLPAPGAITGTIETRFGSDRYPVMLRKDEKWKFAAQARTIGSPLDLDLSLQGPDGKELATSDDAGGTTDAAIPFLVLADGVYQVVVTDRSGKSGLRSASYRLVAEPQREEFSLTLPALAGIPLGGQVKLAAKLQRDGGFQGPVTLTLAGLPEGVTAPAELKFPEKGADLAIDLNCAASAPAAAALCTVTATAKLGDQMVSRPAGQILLATVMKPRCKIIPEGLDDVRKVHRGSTYLAPLIVERLEGYQGEVVLEMTAKQQRHRQGLASADMTVPAGTTRTLYPIFVPEWMETTKTSRMILNGVVRVPDPKGQLRTLINRMELRIGILPEGALMKLGHLAGDATISPGGELRIPLTLSRSPEFREAVRIELVPEGADAAWVSAEPTTLAFEQGDPALLVRVAADPRALGEKSLKIRATALKEGRWPVTSETTLELNVVPNR